MKNAIRYEVLSKGVREIEGTDLIPCLRGAKRIARSMANRLGAAVIVRHDLSLPTVDARIEAQRVIHRFRRVA
jgi:hypothetical protein